MMSTARANLSVGPPYDLAIYRNGSPRAWRRSGSRPTRRCWPSCARCGSGCWSRPCPRCRTSTREELTGSPEAADGRPRDRLDALYAGPPGEFIAARNALAKDAEGGGRGRARPPASRRSGAPPSSPPSSTAWRASGPARWGPSSTPRRRWPTPRPRCWPARATRRTLGEAVQAEEAAVAALAADPAVAAALRAAARGEEEREDLRRGRLCADPRRTSGRASVRRRASAAARRPKAAPRRRAEAPEPDAGARGRPRRRGRRPPPGQGGPRAARGRRGRGARARGGRRPQRRARRRGARGGARRPARPRRRRPRRRRRGGAAPARRAAGGRGGR